MRHVTHIYICTCGRVDAVDVYTHVHMTHIYEDVYIYIVLVCCSALQRNETHHTHEYITSHATHWYVWSGSIRRVLWIVYTGDVTLSCAWHDSFMCAMRCIHVCDATHFHVWSNAYGCVLWIIYKCGVTHSRVWRDSFTCDVTHSCVWRDSFESQVPPLGSWLGAARRFVHGPTSDIKQSYVWCDSFICVTWPIYLCLSYSCVWRDSYDYCRVTGTPSWRLAWGSTLYRW